MPNWAWAILISISVLLILLRNGIMLYDYLSFWSFMRMLRKCSWQFDEKMPAAFPSIRLADPQLLRWPRTVPFVRYGSVPPFSWSSINRIVGVVFFGIKPSADPPNSFTIFFPSKGKIRWEGNVELIPDDILEATPHVKYIRTGYKTYVAEV